MARGDEAIVREFFGAFRDGSDAMRQLAHADIVYVEDPAWPGAGTYEGRAAVVECWTRYDELLGDGANASVVEVRDLGDSVVAVVDVSGRTRDSGIPYSHRWAYRCRTRDERVAYFHAYFRPDEAFKTEGSLE